MYFYIYFVGTQKWVTTVAVRGEGARDGGAVMRRRCCWGEVRRELGLHSVRLLLLQLRGKRSWVGTAALWEVDVGCLSCNGQLGSVWGRETERDRRCGRRKKGWRRFEGKMETTGGLCAAERGETIFNRGAAAGRRRLSFLGLGFFCIFFMLSKLPPL